MTKWATIVRAVDPMDGVLKTWCGPKVSAPTFALAHEYCQSNGLGYCQVVGEILMEADSEGNEVDYEKIRQN